MAGIVGRGLACGAVAGVVAGAPTGTALAGPLGMMFGALAGALWGATYGVVGGLALAGLERLGGRRASARVVAAATSMSCALLTAAGCGRFTIDHRATAVIFALVCTAVGALLGPAVMVGIRPLVVGRHHRLWQDAASRLLVVLLVVCAGAGAVTGLVIGVDAYVPTALAAAIEGAVLGAGAGLVLWALAALVLYVPRLRATR